jgi:hypothetical protein
MTNLYYVKSERYSGSDSLAVVADDIDEAIKKYRAEMQKRWEEWAKDYPSDAQGESADLSIGSIKIECEIDVL